MRVYDAKLVYEPTVFQVGAKSLNSPELVYAYMKDVLEVHPMQELFYVILPNQKNRPLGRVAVTCGTVSSTLVHAREVFRPAILAGASGIICVHNHPSGDSTPSSADICTTRKLREAAGIIDIPLLDHVTISDRSGDAANVGFYSFRSAGFL